MHVLYLIDSLGAGGAERSLAALAPHFTSRGVDLDVAYLYDRENVWASALQAAGVETLCLAGDGGKPGAVVRARQLLRQRRPDVFHTTLFDADVVGRSAALGVSVPVVTSLVNEAYGEEQLRNPRIKPWKLRAAQLVDAVTARRVTRFHAVSNNVATTMSRRLRIPTDRIEVIPRGRDRAELGASDRKRRARVRRQLGVGDGAELVLAVGRHEYQKGFDVLVDAFAAVHAERPTAKLLVAGPAGNESARLEERLWSAGLGRIVEFIGFRSDVPDLMCAADAFVSPSRWEGSPGAILEAMALDVPIVATDIPSVREVFGGEDLAAVAPPDNPAALATAIVSVLAAPSQSRIAAAHARFEQHYTTERIADRMIALYETVRARARRA